jgi:hypothetical protein
LPFLLNHAFFLNGFFPRYGTFLKSDLVGN